MARKYTAIIGPLGLSFYSHTDEYARKVVERWIRLFWAKYLAYLQADYPGSIACAIADGWYDKPPKVALGYWTPDDAGVIPCVRATMVFDGIPVSSFMKH